MAAIGSNIVWLVFLPIVIIFLALAYQTHIDSQKGKKIRATVEKKLEDGITRREIYNDLLNEYGPWYKAALYNATVTAPDPKPRTKFSRENKVLTVLTFIIGVLNTSIAYLVLAYLIYKYYGFAYVLVGFSSLIATLRMLKFYKAGVLFVINIAPYLVTSVLAFYLNFKMFPVRRFGIMGPKTDNKGNYIFEQKETDFKAYLKYLVEDYWTLLKPLLMFMLVASILAFLAKGLGKLFGLTY